MNHLLPLAALLALPALAQQQEEVDYRDEGLLYQGLMEPSVDYWDWNNLPYQGGDKEFRLGDVCFKGYLYRQVPLRLNLYTQDLVTILPQSQYHMVIDPQRIDYFVLDGHTYLRVGERYMTLLAQQPDACLFDCEWKERGFDIEEQRHYIHQFITKRGYFLVQNGEIRQLSKRKAKAMMHSAEATPFALREALDLIPHTHYVSSIDPTLVTYMTDSATIVEPKLITTFPLLDRQTNLEQSDQNLSDYQKRLDKIEPPVREYLIEEITVVSGNPVRVHTATLGVEHIKPALLKNIPLVMGELDVMKLMQTLPGVKSTGEASGGFNVRGSSADQNLILFNQGTMYNPTHLFGMFSVFNPDLINDADLYKGSVPAQYGGRIASVLNITSRQADKEQWKGSASLGLLTSRATIEAPIVKGKLSWLLSGRATYGDWLLGYLPDDSDYSNGSAGFWDLGGVLSYTPNNKTRLNLYHYYSHDRFAFDADNKYSYANLNLGLELRHHYSDALTLQINGGMDHYDYENQETTQPVTAAQLNLDLNQYYIKTHALHRLDEHHTLRYGLCATALRIMPGKYVPLGEASTVAPDQLENDNAFEAALYAEDEWTMNNKLTFTGGLRLNNFGRYIDPDVRFAARYLFQPHTSMKIGFSTMHQYVHKVSNTLLMSPTDIWKLSDADIRPQSGWQASAGLFHETTGRGIEFSAEVYYKSLDNYLTYKSSAQLIMNHRLRDEVLQTRGKAYGIELQLKRPMGRLNGWVSYEYSRTFLRTKDQSINRGAWFPAEYDRPHSVKAVANLKFTERYSISSNMDFSSGCATTIPVGFVYDYELGQNRAVFTDRNTYRLPNYFRLDASFNIEPSHHLTNLTHSMFSIGVYNATGRRNVYSMYYRIIDGELRGYRLSIFGVPIPFVSYSIKF